MSENRQVWIVMSNPPETHSSYPVAVYEDEEEAAKAADETSFGYCKLAPYNKT